MPSSRSWLARARLALASHVDRLNDTLVTVTQRLRETVAQAVSSSLAGAVREAVHALFSDDEPSREPPPYYQRPPYRSRPYWGEPDREDRDEDDLPREEWSHDQSRGWREVESEQPEPTRPPDNNEGNPTRFHHALAVGCQAVAWWLRRQAGRVTAIATLGIGLVATGAAFVAGIGLCESALHLLSLADAMRSGTQALACLS